eukprot:TRINITY_DN93582_c0_g1_i1.p1 TRINITY_DN93582_c0_g1~~TRINITY_DN93582_c0_g1_i1.p1  ORF type:complete len:369 (+),score=66.09 TRINITY_DN93582_c0_g1_i1:100-1206(+)
MKSVITFGLFSCAIAGESPEIFGSPPVLSLEILQAQKLATLESNVTLPCPSWFVPECKKPDLQYSSFVKSQPGVQWMDHGGYCGSWSVQRATLAKGAWISQKQVRSHTVPGGGHDEEILATSIEKALTNLKLKFEGFKYKELPTPQANAYRKWIKAQLVARNAVVWMIMLRGGHFPVYPNMPYGQYSHVEPVVGLMSSRPLNDTEFYDDDVIAHYTDADEHTYYRRMDSLPDDTDLQGNCAKSDYPGYPCVYNKYGFGWAIQGFQDEKEGLPLSLAVDPSKSEPDTRLGQSPKPITGTVTAEGLAKGKKYAIYRWNDVDSAFDRSKAHSIHRFVASGETEVWTDAETFMSDSATYYRCYEDVTEEVVV